MPVVFGELVWPRDDRLVRNNQDQWHSACDLALLSIGRDVRRMSDPNERVRTSPDTRTAIAKFQEVDAALLLATAERVTGEPLQPLLPTRAHERAIGL